MSFVPSQGNQVLVDTPDSAGLSQSKDQQQANTLTSWLVGKAEPWKMFRERGYSKRWAEYWRMWRGRWSSEDKNRLSERSRLIAPALAQAIEMSVSEIEEGLFSKAVWFDISDDIQDEEKLDALLARDQLLEDLGTANITDVISEAVLNSAIFGTGIVKMNVEVRTEGKPVRDQQTFKLEPSDRERVLVTFESIRPDQFIPDPAATRIGDMLGAFHEVTKPMHSVLEKIESGIYRRDALAALMPAPKTDNYDIDAPEEPQAFLSTADSDQVTILEYHGKVPMRLLDKAMNGPAKNVLDAILEQDMRERPDKGDGPLVEAIVTIANNSVLLRAMANPFVMKDRSMLAFQFEKVPGRFWGRGVAEKGYNPQKALDAELRARIDALGFISSPMLGVDSGRMPRGFRMEVKPGKIWLTQGNPNEILNPVQIGRIDGSTFNQTSEMERMVQMGTGAFDTSTALNNQSSQSGASAVTSNSALMGAFVKRSKRAIRNVNDNLMRPLIRKAMWRYMQFDPRRYPQDFEFNVQATMGIVAREVEAMQLTQLIGMMPQEFPQVSVAVARGIIELSALHNKAQVMKAIDEALAPPSEEEQRKQKELQDMQFMAVRAEAQGKLLENQKTMAEIRKILNEALVAARKADVEDEKVQQEQQRIMLQLQELEESRQANKLDERRLDLEAERIDIERQKAKRESSSS